MLAIENPRDYDKNPIKLARDAGGDDIYYVKNGELPGIRPRKDPFEYLSQDELYAMKKRYRVPTSVFKRIRKCYKNKHEHIDLGDDSCIENHLVIKEIEASILKKMKRVYINKSAKLLPFYDPKITGKIALHTSIIASSGSGKSYLTAEIVGANFPDSSVYVFSPTANRDPAYTALKQKLGAKKVRLIKSNSIDIPLSEDMIPNGSVVIFDDVESTLLPARKYISDLQSRLLYHGRHLRDKHGSGITCISVMHDAFRQKETKAASIESSRICLFPNTNRAISTKYMKNRLNFTAAEIKQLYEFVGDSRWVCIYSHHPLCAITSTGVMLR